jgi:hypothetical protein
VAASYIIVLVTLIDTAKIGRKGGKARAANLSAEELAAAGRKAVNARWTVYYKLHPEKLKAKRARAKKAKAAKAAKA